MAHGKSLELSKIKPKYRLWINPGGITLTRADWKKIRKRAGWEKDQAPKIKHHD